MKRLTLSIICVMTIVSAISAQKSNISESARNQVVDYLVQHSTISKQLIERGVSQAAAFWTEEDGTQQEFAQFCMQNFCKDKEEKQQLFERLCNNFEIIFGHNNRVSIDLQRPDQVAGYNSTIADKYFSAYSGLAHFEDDMFESKLAFLVILNFPNFTLKEKNSNGQNWTETEWGYVRLGDVFTSRIPSKVQQDISNVSAAANHYIDSYNIDMKQVGSFTNQFYWNSSLPLITHWGLRDELKAAYADTKNGLEKQQVIYDVMKRIINCDVPVEVAKNDLDFAWHPSTNQLMLNGIEYISRGKEKQLRYKYILDFFHAEKAADKYCSGNRNFIDRKFEDEYEISVDEAEKLFTDLLSSPVVKQVGNLISKRLGRKLQPFDLWYDGFKNRSSINQDYLDSLIRGKYPTKDAFAKDLPNIMRKLGFPEDKVQLVCKNVHVDPSVGAGHALESKMKGDPCMLRTRIGENGMDYKGYNIGVHEFGHNVEQTITLYDVPNYFLSGVPNTAFTEALAFVFQGKDLELLGVDAGNDPNAENLNTLDLFWNCYEIMGVALTEIKVWKWLYANPNATEDQLKKANIDIAKEVWNAYYAPVFKSKDQEILAIYSHAVIDPLYLAAYPVGHLIDFQLEEYFKGKVIGPEVIRMFKNGRITPKLWMQRALGSELSAQPLIIATENAVKSVK